MIKKQIELFFISLMFYTRIPVPGSVVYSSEKLNKATRYFPLVGMLVGGVGALVYFLIASLGLIPIAIVFSLVVMILITGGFHEDGLADSFDGFGGGYSKPEVLSIMKDSRIGTFGALSLILLLLLKFVLISELPVKNVPVIILLAHALSRLNPILLIYTSNYISIDDKGKAKDVGKRGSFLTLLIALIFALIPLVLIEWIFIPILLAVLLVILISFRWYVLRRIGGYTGDLLGALQQFSEVGIYLTLIIGGQFI